MGGRKYDVVCETVKRHHKCISNIQQDAIATRRTRNHLHRAVAATHHQRLFVWVNKNCNNLYTRGKLTGHPVNQHTHHVRKINRLLLGFREIVLAVSATSTSTNLLLQMPVSADVALLSKIKSDHRS